MALNLLSFAWRYRLTIMVGLLAFAAYNTAINVSEILGSTPLIVCAMVIGACSYASYRVGISANKELKLPTAIRDTFTPKSSASQEVARLQDELALVEQRLAAERVINGGRPATPKPTYSYEQ